MRVPAAYVAAILVICACVISGAYLSSCGGKRARSEATEAPDKDDMPPYMRTEGAATPLDRSIARQSRTIETGRATKPQEVGPKVIGPPIELPAGLPEIDPTELEKEPEDVNDPGVRIEMANGGEIIIELFATKAPLTTAHFVEIVKDGFFDGLSFHRSDEMCIQGGDATLAGKQAWGKKVNLEVSGVPFDAGSVGMARTQDPNSADSQFFIAKKRAEHLDTGYANFGQVLKGMKVVLALPARGLEASAATSPISPDARMKKVSLVRFKGWE